jgi:hypothetical protein
VLALATQARAQSDSTSVRDGDRKFGVLLGGVLLHFDTRARADSEILGTGTEIGLESDLDMPDNETEIRFGFFYRFGRRHRFDVSGFYSDRTGRKTIDQSIQWDDTLFDGGTLIDSRMEYGSVRAAYQYSFYKGKRNTAGFLAGLSVVDFSGSLTSVGEIDGQQVDLVTEQDEFLFPVPVVGLAYSHRFSDRFRVGATADYFFYEESDEWEANLFQQIVVAEYGFKTWLRGGLGLEIVSIRYEDIDSDGFEVDYDYEGILGYLGFVF